MKRFTVEFDHKAGGNADKLNPAVAPFAENRYRKYHFQRESIVLNAPASSGVYGLYSALWIFIGEAEDIRARLLEHLAGDRPCINRHQPSGFAFELIPQENRLRRWVELIKELEPSCNDKSPRLKAARGAASDGERPSLVGQALYVAPKLGGEPEE